MYMKTKNESAVFKLFLLFAAVLLCSLFSPGADAKAASNRTLSTGRTYTAYDVTGDGKADTIRLTKGGYTSYDMYTSLTVTVNGSTAYTYKDAYYYGFSVKLLTLNNGKVFLFITGWGDNDDGSAHLLQYKNSTKKFKKIADFGTMFYKYGFHVNSNVQSVSGNKIVIRTNLMSYSLAGVSFDMTFSYKSGSLTPASKLTVNYVNSGTSGQTLTANKKLTTYTSASLSKKSFSISSGKKVYISALYYKNGKLSVKVRAYGKYGYLKPLTSYTSNPPFKNLMYAG